MYFLPSYGGDYESFFSMKNTLPETNIAPKIDGFQ